MMAMRTEERAFTQSAERRNEFGPSWATPNVGSARGGSSMIKLKSQDFGGEGRGEVRVSQSRPGRSLALPKPEPTLPPAHA